MIKYSLLLIIIISAMLIMITITEPHQTVYAGKDEDELSKEI